MAIWFVILNEVLRKARGVFFFRRKHPINDGELNAYVDDQLAAGARDRLETHVESCSACRETLVELRAVRQALHDLPHERAPRSFALRQADVEAPVPTRAAGAFAGAPSLLGALATVSIVAFVVLVAVDAGGTPTGGSGADSVPLGFVVQDDEGTTGRWSGEPMMRRCRANLITLVPRPKPASTEVGRMRQQRQQVPMSLRPLSISAMLRTETR